MKLKRFPNGLQPSGQTSWGHGLRFCIFALIGLQARRLWGEPDSGVNRRVGPRTQPAEAGRPRGTASQPLHYLLSWGITHGLGLGLSTCPDPCHVAEDLRLVPYQQWGFHPLLHSLGPISVWSSYLFSKIKANTEKKKKKKLKTFLDPLPLWL